MKNHVIMDAVELTLEKTMPIWWAFSWRAFLFSIVGGAIMGGIAGFIFGVTGNPELGGSVGSLVGFLTSIPISIWSLKVALNKKYNGISIVLVRR